MSTDCGGVECCFVMGGCDDGRAYPPARQTALDESMSDLDPSLAYDVSEYGHLGYDASVGAPNVDAPVQGQYTGTWAMYEAPNDSAALAAFLASKVVEHVEQN